MGVLWSGACRYMISTLGTFSLVRQVSTCIRMLSSPKFFLSQGLILSPIKPLSFQHSMSPRIVSAFLAFDTNFKHLDTAFMYCGGKTQTILGDMECWKERGLMGDKINPWDKKNFGEESIRMQVDTCLTRLKVPKVEIMYLHAPDHNTPMDVTLEVMDKLHKEGKFNQLGLSNYSSWLVGEVVNLCKANNWIKPTVYQGMYSTITRQVEEELIPCLRYHGIAFYAYSPLGGGILSGKYKFDEEESKKITKGRFNGVGR